MALESLTIWQQTFKDEVPPVSDASWPDSITDWYADRFDDPRLSLPGLTINVPPLPVVFGKAAFKGKIVELNPGLSQSAAMTIVADAWELGLNASTVSVIPLDAIGVPSPTTQWSSVTSSVFDPTSVAAGKSKILELIGAPNVDDALDAQFPVKFREATLLLTVTTTGLDSVAPTPNPLTDPTRAVA